jgi:hypothetical protein
VISRRFRCRTPLAGVRVIVISAMPGFNLYLAGQGEIRRAAGADEQVFAKWRSKR